MDAKQQKMQKSRERILAAIRNEKPDRTPLLLGGEIAFAKYADPSVVAADFVERPLWAIDKAVEGLDKLKYADYVWAVGLPLVFFSSTWMSKIKMPGRELGRDELWQIAEHPCMQEEDYDLILKKGWLSYYNSYMEKNLGVTEEDMQAGMQQIMYSNQKNLESGLAILNQYNMAAIYDRLCAIRGMINFARDMRKMPEKVRAVMDVMLEEEMVQANTVLGQLQATLGEGNFIVFVQPGVRGNSDFISRKQFEMFNWPAFKMQTEAILKAGGNVFFHMDGNWNTFLDYFKEFPKGRCIFDSDGMTDIYKVKEVLGDTMCITGNFGSSLMAMANPDEVYATVKKQIEDIGSDGGYIASTSCTMPPNAKPENMEALVAAVVETKI